MCLILKTNLNNGAFLTYAIIEKPNLVNFVLAVIDCI